MSELFIQNLVSSCYPNLNRLQFCIHQPVKWVCWNDIFILFAVSLNFSNVHLNSSAVSPQRLTWGGKRLSKSSYFPKAKPPKQRPQVIMRRKNVTGNNCERHCVSGGTRASCSLDQLQQGYLTPSPPHQCTHHIDGERLHQSNTTPRETQAFRPLGKTLETVLKIQQNINKWAAG